MPQLKKLLLLSSIAILSACAARWDNADYWGGRLSIVKIYEGDIGASGVTTSWNTNKARFGL